MLELNMYFKEIIKSILNNVITNEKQFSMTLSYFLKTATFIKQVVFNKIQKHLLFLKEYNVFIKLFHELTDNHKKSKLKYFQILLKLY